MTVAPVGLRCPDHSGKARGLKRVTTGAGRVGIGTTAFVTRVLIAINVAVYALELALGGSIDGTDNWLYEHGVLRADLVADGDWWRVLTSAFLHYGPLHLGMNMLALAWFGGPLEQALGRARFIGLYLASGLAGAAGALLVTPNGLTVGASGAIYGLFGAAFVLERSGALIFGGQALTIIVLNLVISLGYGGQISIGGHVGGLLGGILVMLAILEFRRSVPLSALSIVAVGAASVVIAYLKVRGYA